MYLGNSRHISRRLLSLVKHPEHLTPSSGMPTASGTADRIDLAARKARRMRFDLRSERKDPLSVAEISDNNPVHASSVGQSILLIDNAVIKRNHGEYSAGV